MSKHAASFTPAPDQAAEIVSELGNPDRTLRGIAEEHGTSVEALCLWMATPDVAERLAALHDAAVHRTRFIALNHLPSAVSTLNRIIDDYTDQLTRAPRSASQSPRAAEHRRRLTDGARKAVTLLTSLARLASAPRRKPAPPPSPSQWPGVGSFDAPSPGNTPSAPTQSPEPEPAPSTAPARPARIPLPQLAGVSRAKLPEASHVGMRQAAADPRRLNRPPHHPTRAPPITAT